MRNLHDRMMAFHAAGNRLDYYKLNHAVHSAIAALSDNACLLDTHDAIQFRLKRVRFLAHAAPANWESAVAPHETAGIVGTLMNFAGSTGGVLVPIIAGLILQVTGAYDWVLYFFAGCALLFIIGTLLISFPRQRVA